MAKITLDRIKHSYLAKPDDPDDWALKEVDEVWEDGTAYALLGPSGCGKTTLLNIISGLITPTHGRVLFNNDDVTNTPTTERHIAQVFQFPVVYDTMTVQENLAFPLRNRGVDKDKIKTRVHEIAKMLDLSEMLSRRASGLTADGKQKISLARGLVRDDVNVIMFDEPLTVIDPHLKWLLRSKLKELHQSVGVTMIYVTHDQTEALTFADRVVVLHEGTVVQIGTPVELFEEPQHTFVGHFIGSPGMNFLPCDIIDGVASFAGNTIETATQQLPEVRPESLEVGVRPEFIHFDQKGFPVKIDKVDDLGRYQLVQTQHQGHSIKIVLNEGEEIPSENPCIVFDPKYTRLYADGWVIN
ncbi:MAG: ABC transporter ATP-binding protein [Arenicellales bacterium]|nr:ABC transporter ATP-binding protein [Arenicellales bacterium]